MNVYGPASVVDNLEGGHKVLARSGDDVIVLHEDASPRRAHAVADYLNTARDHRRAALTAFLGDTPVIEHEVAGRERKANRIVAWLRVHQITAAHVRTAGQSLRDDVCDQMKVRRASDETWEQVLGILDALEKHVPEDPFEGLPGGTK